MTKKLSDLSMYFQAINNLKLGSNESKEIKSHEGTIDYQYGYKGKINQ